MNTLAKNSGTETSLSAATVCEPCKKRKKSCNKGLPSCSRCTRLSAKCSYPDTEAASSALPPLTNIVPEYLRNQTLPSKYWSNDEMTAIGDVCSIDDQISSQTSRLLSSISRKRGPIEDFVEIYFQNFHRSLPIIDPENLTWRMRSTNFIPNSHFKLLLLCVFLATELRLSAERDGGAEELYGTLKSFYSLLQASGEVSVELVQAGVIIASWEHCQALPREAWLTVGGCARMGYVLGLHECLREESVVEKERSEWQERRCLWWGIVVLERVINSEYQEHKLPFASEPPRLDDILPPVPPELEGAYLVRDDLITPDMVGKKDQGALFDRDFTKLGHFPSTVQATYLTNLVKRHIQSTNLDIDSRRHEAATIDTALQSFGCTLLPPPGKAEGAYCGAYWMRTNAAFKLHYHELDVELESGTPEGIMRAKISLQSLARVIVEMTKLAAFGLPLDLNKVSFFSHSITHLGAMAHIRFGVRNNEWEDDLEVLKNYVRLFAPIYKLHANYLREIEEEERKYWFADSDSSTSMDTLEVDTKTMFI